MVEDNKSDVKASYKIPGQRAPGKTVFGGDPFLVELAPEPATLSIRPSTTITKSV